MIDIDNLIEEEEELKTTNLNDDNNNDDDNSGLANNSSTNDDNSDDDSPETDSDAVAFFEFLKAEQILDLPEDFQFKGNSESIQEALNLTKKNFSTKMAQQVWNSLPDDFKPILEYGLSGGKSVKEFIESTQEVDLDGLNLDDDLSRKAVIRSYYKILNPKITDEQLDKRIDRLSELADDLDGEAQDALTYLKNYKEEKKQALILQAQAARNQEIENYRKEMETYESLLNSNAEFDDNRKNRLKTFMFNPTANNSNGLEEALDNIYLNPQHKLQLANILVDYDPRTGFNYERIQKKNKTEATKSLKELINSKVDTKHQIRGSQKPSNEDFNWGEYFNN